MSAYQWPAAFRIGPKVHVMFGTCLLLRLQSDAGMFVPMLNCDHDHLFLFVRDCFGCRTTFQCMWQNISTYFLLHRFRFYSTQIVFLIVWFLSNALTRMKCVRYFSVWPISRTIFICLSILQTIIQNDIPFPNGRTFRCEYFSIGSNQFKL